MVRISQSSVLFSLSGLSACLMAWTSVFSVVAVSPVSAGILVTENFDSYAVKSNVNGLIGGTGWSGAWSSNSGYIDPAGTGNALWRGSFHSSNRSFNSMGTSGIQIFTWKELAGGLPNGSRRFQLSDGSSANIAQLQGTSFVSNGGTLATMTATGEAPAIALTMNYDTGMGSLTTSSSFSDIVIDSISGLITANNGSPASSILNFAFDNTKAAAKITFWDSTNRIVDDIAFGTGVAAATAIGFTVAGGGAIPEPSSAAIAMLMIGGGALRRFRRSRATKA